MDELVFGRAVAENAESLFSAALSLGTGHPEAL